VARGLAVPPPFLQPVQTNGGGRSEDFFFLFLIMVGLIVFENIIYENEILRKRNVFLRVLLFFKRKENNFSRPRVESVPVIFWNHLWRRETLHNTCE
jgi:hypothetical protein